ncbi:PREDICTED: general odorant-binding protein 19d-like [Papilio polytes]|uniref:general odorant-binding protein 19d-like n=1 Tax=Papilio polytes TaxID=76194 RepID=UPI000676A669|nr:PREDICTED: general odorant-binding protein 19d-like [Papilio polytes]
MYKLYLYVNLCLIALMPFKSHAMTAEQKAAIHEHFEELGTECMKDYPITEEDVNNLRAKKIGTGENVPCFLSCLLKKVGIMDDKGMLQKETALEYAKKVFNDAEELKLIEGYLHSCSHINGETVTDGEKGCDRALLSFQCMLENASQFGFDV